MSEHYLHTPVLLDEVVHGLNLRPDGIYLDGTFGRGGHTRLILSKLNEQGRLFAIDCDPSAIEAAQAIDDARFTIIPGTFSAMLDYITARELVGHIDGILLDLGVSSPQIDDPARGFSFMRDGPLDMRMDNTRGQSAAQWLAQAATEEISLVLKNFGDERFAKRIAQAIVTRNRQWPPITRTNELSTLIAKVIPFHNHHKHPATRSFQAIRIYINNELEEIKHALNCALKGLAPCGRLVVISFHSIEDRLVKKFIYQHSYGPQLPLGLPLTESQIAAQQQDWRQLKILGKMYPSAQEIKNNPRSRSSVLRFAEKLSQ